MSLKLTMKEFPGQKNKTHIIGLTVRETRKIKSCTRSKRECESITWESAGKEPVELMSEGERSVRQK